MHEGQVKHLDFIQAAIGRMAQNSFTMKGWAVTLVSAILVVAHEIGGWQYLLIALLPAFVFWGFDAYYLSLERMFRELYEEVRLQGETEWTKDPFRLDPYKMREKVDNWLDTCWSNCVVWLYLPMVILILLATIYTALCQK